MATLFLSITCLVLVATNVILVRWLNNLIKEVRANSSTANQNFQNLDRALNITRDSIIALRGRMTSISRGLETLEGDVKKMEERVHTLEVKSDVTSYKY